MRKTKKAILSFCLLLSFAVPVFSQDSSYNVIKGDTVFKKVGKESTFKGGAEGWTKYLQSSLVYPAKATRKKIEDVVVVQFIVDEKGYVHDAEVLSGHRMLAPAALAVIQQSPRWIPAELDGKKVKSYKKQPIQFRLL